MQHLQEYYAKVTKGKRREYGSTKCVESNR